MLFFFFRYVKGEDPADWIAVDPVTGNVTTVKPLDRESPYVRNGVYNVTILAVDDGMSWRFSPWINPTNDQCVHNTDINVRVLLSTRISSGDGHCDPHYLCV